MCTIRTRWDKNSTLKIISSVLPIQKADVFRHSSLPQRQRQLKWTGSESENYVEHSNNYKVNVKLLPFHMKFSSCWLKRYLQGRRIIIFTLIWIYCCELRSSVRVVWCSAVRVRWSFPTLCWKVRVPPCRAIAQKDGIFNQLYPHTAYYCEDSNRTALAVCPFAFTTAPASHIKEQGKGKLSFLMQHIIKI